MFLLLSCLFFNAAIIWDDVLVCLAFFVQWWKHHAIHQVSFAIWKIGTNSGWYPGWVVNQKKQHLTPLFLFNVKIYVANKNMMTKGPSEIWLPEHSPNNTKPKSQISKTTTWYGWYNKNNDYRHMYMNVCEYINNVYIYIMSKNIDLSTWNLKHIKYQMNPNDAGFIVHQPSNCSTNQRRLSPERPATSPITAISSNSSLSFNKNHSKVFFQWCLTKNKDLLTSRTLFRYM